MSVPGPLRDGPSLCPGPSCRPLHTPGPEPEEQPPARQLQSRPGSSCEAQLETRGFRFLEARGVYTGDSAGRWPGACRDLGLVPTAALLQTQLRAWKPEERQLVRAHARSGAGASGQAGRLPWARPCGFFSQGPHGLTGHRPPEMPLCRQAPSQKPLRQPAWLPWASAPLSAVAVVGDLAFQGVGRRP